MSRIADDFKSIAEHLKKLQDQPKPSVQPICKNCYGNGWVVNPNNSMPEDCYKCGNPNRIMPRQLAEICGCCGGDGFACDVCGWIEWRLKISRIT